MFARAGQVELPFLLHRQTEPVAICHFFERMALSCLSSDTEMNGVGTII